MQSYEHHDYQLPASVKDPLGAAAVEKHSVALRFLFRKSKTLEIFRDSHKASASRIADVVNSAIYRVEHVKPLCAFGGGSTAGGNGFVTSGYIPSTAGSVKFPMVLLEKSTSGRPTEGVRPGCHFIVFGQYICLRAPRHFRVFLLGVTHSRSLQFNLSTYITKGQVLFANGRAESEDARLVPLSTVGLPFASRVLADFIAGSDGDWGRLDRSDSRESTASEGDDSAKRRRSSICSSSSSMSWSDNSSDRMSVSSSFDSLDGCTGGDVVRTPSPTVDTLRGTASNEEMVDPYYTDRIDSASSSSSHGHSGLINTYVMPRMPPLRHTVSLGDIERFVGTWMQAIYVAARCEIEKFDSFMDTVVADGMAKSRAWSAARWIICSAMSHEDDLADMFVDSEVTIATRAYTRCTSLEQKVAMCRANGVRLEAINDSPGMSDVAVYREHVRTHTRRCVERAQRMWNSDRVISTTVMEQVERVLEYVQNYLVEEND